MTAARIDYRCDPQPLLRSAGLLLAVGVVVATLMSLGLPWWLRLTGAAVLLVCALGLFVTSARWFTREFPVLSLHNDRIAYRGLREQVVMLRNVGGAAFDERRLLGLRIPMLELELRDDDEPVAWPLWAVALSPQELIAQIEARVVALEREHGQT